MGTVLTRFANGNAVVTTGWTNPANAYADDSSFATCSPAKGTYVNSDFSFPAFPTSDIPDDAVINSVTVSARTWGAASALTESIQGVDNGTLAGSAVTTTATAETTITATVPAVLVSDLRSGLIRARVGATRTGNTAYTASLDWVSISVDWSPAAPKSASGSGSAGVASTLAATGGKSGVSNGAAIVVDRFARTSASGWGDAETGGTWSVYATGAQWSTDGSLAKLACSAGTTYRAWLPAALGRDVELTLRVATDKLAVGGNMAVYPIVRGSSRDGDFYRCCVTFTSAQTVTVAIDRYVAGVQGWLGNAVTVAGLTHAVGRWYAVRFQVVGAYPTILRAKVWDCALAEPAAWSFEVADDAPTLQLAGWSGLRAYYDAGATNAPLTASFDDFTARQVGIASTPSLAADGHKGGIGAAVASFLTTLAGDGAQTAARIIREGLGSVAYVTSLAAAGRKGGRGGGKVGTTSAIAAAGSKAGRGSGALPTASTLVALGRKLGRGQGGVATTSTIAPSGRKQGRGAGSVTVASSLASTTRKGVSATAGGALTTTLASTGHKVGRGSASVTMTWSLAGFGVAGASLSRTGSGAIVATFTLVGAGSKRVGGAAAARSTVGLAVAGRKATGGTAGAPIASHPAARGAKGARGEGSVTLRTSLAAPGRTWRAGSGAIVATFDLVARGVRWVRVASRDRGLTSARRRESATTSRRVQRGPTSTR